MNRSPELVANTGPLKPDRESDEDLAQRFARSNDRQAFAELVRRYSPLLRRMLYSLVGSDPDALLDAEQEVFLTLSTGISRFRGDARFSTFFYSLARNRVIDLMRKQRRDLQRVQRGLDADQLVSPDRGPAELGARSADVALLQAALAGIPEGDRMLLYLKDGEDHTIAELSEMTGTPEGTLKSRLSRARKKVAARMEELGYER